VPIEEQVLPHADLKPLYGRVVWMWVYRDFKNGPDDRAAERVHNRMGVSSWPHLLFADSTGRVVAESGRTTASILATAEKAQQAVPKGVGTPALDARLSKAREGKSRKPIEELAKERDAGEYWMEARDVLWALDGRKPAATAKDLADPDVDRRADALDALLEGTTAFAPEAAGLVKDPDADVRMRAVKYVAKAAPAKLAGLAGDLLADPMDAVQFAALDAMKESKDEAIAPALVEAWRKLDAGKIESRNPNVLRGRLAAGMGDLAGEEAVPLLGDFAAKHEFLNGTTHMCVAALGKIGKRRGAKHVAAALVASFPPAVTAEDEQRKVAAHCLRLARGVHDALVEATGVKSIAFPAAWKEKERAAAVAAWKAR